MCYLGIVVPIFFALATADNNCPENWTRGPSNKCYQLFSKSANYEESIEFCASQKATLVSMETREEADWIREFTKAIKRYDQHAFLGLRAPPCVKCQFKWLNGKMNDPSIIEISTKHSGGCYSNEFCAVIDTPSNWAPNAATLGDCICEGRHPRVMCEKLVGEGACPEQWTRGPSTKCYRIFNQKANFDESKTYCSALNASLVVLENREEAEWIVEFTNFIRLWSSQPFLGVQTVPCCQFEWINGRKLNNSVVGLTSRGGGGCMNNEFCATIDQSANWQPNNRILGDCKCEDRHPHVMCERMLRPECFIGQYDENVKACVQKTHPWYLGHPIHHNYGLILKEKCEGVPWPSYFDIQTGICYVATQNCYRVVYPGRAVYARRTSILDARFGLLRYSQTICAFEENRKCSHGLPSGDYCLWKTEGPSSWGEAASNCQKDNGTLFVPRDDGDMQSILDFFRKSPSVENETVWLGIVKSERWISIDSAPLDYFRWKPTIEKRPQITAAVFVPTITQAPNSYVAYMAEDEVTKSLYGLCSSRLQE